VWWLAVPATAIFGAALQVADVGLTLRVALCEDSLDRFVATVKPGGKGDHEPRWVGLFRVDYVQEYEGGVYLFTSDSFINQNGVAHLPNGAPVAPRMRVRHLYGPWYNFEWRF
jgi:hypothetical protein